MPPAIELDHLSKRFRKYRSIAPSTTLKAAFFDWLRGRTPADTGPGEFDAIRDASFQIERGETFGIIGRNGAGKSTLLKLIARIYKPDAGRVIVDGRVAALIELGAGFHPEFTGAENVMMNGMLLGLSRAEVRERFDAIVAFAEIGDFIHAPVRVYSSGMYLRLAFSVAIHVDSDILLIDEILAVGDEAFKVKCLDAIRARVASQARTTVIVSHDLDLVAGLCRRVAFVDPPEVRVFSYPGEAIDAYRRSLDDGLGVTPKDPAPSDPGLTIQTLQDDLDEIARLLDVSLASVSNTDDGPGKTAVGRAIIRALTSDGRKVA